MLDLMCAQAPASRPARRVVRWTALVLLGLLFLAACGVAALRWVNPPITAVMLHDSASSSYSWVDAPFLGSNVAVAILAAEDQQFTHRSGGVDWSALYGRTVDGAHRGGSTLQEQLAKNLFLWKHKDPLRKLVLEPVLGNLIAWELPRNRQLELYANVVQMGPGVWGACAASWYYYDRDPASLTLDEAADLVAVLPYAGSARRAAEGGPAMPADGLVARLDARLRAKAYLASGGLGGVDWPSTSTKGRPRRDCRQRPARLPTS